MLVLHRIFPTIPFHKIEDVNFNIYKYKTIYIIMKVQKTFTITKEVYEKFLEISSKNSLNKSLFIENMINDYIKNNTKSNDIIRKD